MIERTYVIPLRQEFLKVQRYKRAKKAQNAIKDFLAQHMKVERENVKIMTLLNEEVWKHGIRNPPCRVKVVVQKDDKGIVRAQLFGQKIELPKEKEAEKTGVKKLAEKVAGAIIKDKSEEKKGEEKKEESKSEGAKPNVQGPKKSPAKKSQKWPENKVAPEKLAPLGE